MEIFRQRASWTRRWLNNYTKPHTTNTDDFEIVNHDDTTGSDYGIVALSDSNSQSTRSSPSSRLSLSAPSQCCHTDQPVEHDFDDDNTSLWSYFHCALWDDTWERCLACDICTMDDPDGVAQYGQDFSEALAYEMAGRAPNQDFRDIRSASKAKKRTRADREKYWNYRALKPGQRNQLHRDMKFDYTFGAAGCLLPCNAEIVKLTPKMMYQQAQKYPRPPKYHRRRGDKDYSPWRAAVERRVELQKHQSWWNVNDQTNMATRKCAGTRLSMWMDERAAAYMDCRPGNYCDACDAPWESCTGYLSLEDLALTSRMTLDRYLCNQDKT